MYVVFDLPIWGDVEGLPRERWWKGISSGSKVFQSGFGVGTRGEGLNNLCHCLSTPEPAAREVRNCSSELWWTTSATSACEE